MTRPNLKQIFAPVFRVGQVFALTLAVATFATGLFGQEKTPLDLSAELDKIRKEYEVPGMVAALVVGDRVVASGAAGVRKLGDEEPITVQDKIHLGSCTKALTATVLATLVAEGKLSWDQTLADTWTSLKKKQNPAFKDVTLQDLLAHRGGVIKDVDWWQVPGRTMRAKRARLVEQTATQPPAGKHGDYLYSNLGIVIAGAMAERVTGQDWEKLMQQRLFKPLKMESAGFGPPSTEGKLDQPWGHSSAANGLKPSQIDNAPSLGPAGTVHMSVLDWAKFASLHLKALPSDEAPLTHEMIDQIHVPYESGDNNRYGFGWIVVPRTWAGGDAVTHGGSNTTWWATIWVAPEKNVAFLAIANSGTDRARQSTDAAITKMLRVWQEGNWD